ncbi:MAG: acyl--CoA ligase, partial [Planctomycetes bacterium]|nr:acyl--CoA ligase [Planctomycetota bacterium]
MKIDLVHRFLEQRAQEQPESLLLMEAGQSATYGDVESGANRVAQALLGERVRRGDRVGLLSHNSRGYIEAYYGILKAGAIAVPLNAGGAWRDHLDLLDRCQAKGLICGPRSAPRSEGLARLRQLQFILGTAAEWEGRLAKDAACRTLDLRQAMLAADDRRPDLPLAERDRASIVYTSGTTGEPKGVTLTHANIVVNTQSIVQYLQVTRRDRVFVVLPFHYVYGKSLLNTHVAAGGSVVIENHFLFPQRALDHLDESAATGFSGVPSTFAILLNRSNLADRDLPHLRYVTQAGG